MQAWYLCKRLCLADGVIQVLSCTSKCIPLQEMLTCVGTFEVWKYNCTSNLTLYLKTSKYWPTAQLKSVCATVHAGRTLQRAANICTEDNHSLKAAYRRLSPGNFVAVSHYCTALDFYFWEKRKKKSGFPISICSAPEMPSPLWQGFVATNAVISLAGPSPGNPSNSCPSLMVSEQLTALPC